VSAACHAQHTARGNGAGIVLGILGAAALWFFTRHLSRFASRAGKYMASLCLIWLPVLTLAGNGWWTPLALAMWLGLMTRWAKRYRWRPDEKKPEPDASDAVLWAATLGAKGRLAGSSLTLPREIPGGVQYTLALKRGDHDSADVFGMSKKVASLFGKPVTEAYPERFPDGREHQVMLTVLKRNALAQVRHWDGESIDPATGLAAIGDFPDGTPAHFRFWSPRNGAEQSIIVGVKGSGKSYLLHLLLSLAVTSEIPVIPIVLDPQQGQSMPDWRGQIPYARGIAECALYLRAIEAGMTARSEHLADFAWTDEDGYDRPGMDFYDPVLSGLPLIFVVFDEAHLVLADQRFGEQAVRSTGNMAKLNRKAGGHLALVSHTLLLSQLGDMTLRAMVVGGNAIALRTGENLSGGIIGLEADPKLLPRRFASGKETHGLGYIVGPDGRPDAPMRARLVRNPRKVSVEATIAEMDPVFGNAFRAVLEAGRKGSVTSRPTRAASAPLAAVPPPDDDKPGRSAIDAVLAVLAAAGRELSKGEIVTRCATLATGDWGREKPFVAKSIGDALAKLTAGSEVEKTGHGTYAPLRASLHSVPQSAPAATEASR
jgi:hypothetical protein